MSASYRCPIQLRSEIELGLANRVPRALTPYLRTESERFACGIHAIDDALSGGIASGAITEFVGPECSGRTSMALAYAAACLQRDQVAAWIDVDDVLDPESAALSGIDWNRLLWVRCGSFLKGETAQNQAYCTRLSNASAPIESAGSPIQQVGSSPHPRSEGRGMPKAIHDLLTAQPRYGAMPPRRRDKSIGTPGVPNRRLVQPVIDREEQIPFDRMPSRRQQENIKKSVDNQCSESQPHKKQSQKKDVSGIRQIQPKLAVHRLAYRPKRTWTPLDQALRATDLLLQAGGFGLLVLDLGSTPAEMSWRIPLATWFRYRAACERSRVSLLLLTRYSCARSSAELIMRMQQNSLEAQGNVLTHVFYQAELERQRFPKSSSNVIPIRKPPRTERVGCWKGHAAWAI